MSGPVLDLGCGDGHFVTTAFDHPIDVGIDPWQGPVRQAAQQEELSAGNPWRWLCFTFSSGLFWKCHEQFCA